VQGTGQLDQETPIRIKRKTQNPSVFRSEGKRKTPEQGTATTPQKPGGSLAQSLKKRNKK